MEEEKGERARGKAVKHVQKSVCHIITYMMYSTALIQFLTYLVTLSRKDNLSTHTPNTVTSKKNMITADSLKERKK